MNISDFKQLQIAQLEHDERFPREITYLSNHRKIVHFTLHFTKYVGDLWEGKNTKVQSIVDSFIISLCAANMLNLDLSKTVFPVERLNEQDLLMAFTIRVGQLAKACEAIDHLENFPVSLTLVNNVLAISHICMKLAELNGIKLLVAVPSRLSIVQDRSIFKQQLLHGPE